MKRINNFSALVQSQSTVLQSNMRHQFSQTQQKSINLLNNIFSPVPMMSNQQQWQYTSNLSKRTSTTEMAVGPNVNVPLANPMVWDALLKPELSSSRTPKV